MINLHLSTCGVDYSSLIYCRKPVLEIESLKGLLYHNAQDIELGLRGPVNWAGRTVQVEATINTAQKGHTAIADAIMEKKMKARGPGCP